MNPKEKPGEEPGGKEGKMSAQSNTNEPEVIGNYRVHPVASMFPLMDEDAYSELKKSIQTHGIRTRICLLDGVLLDGRNRLKAAIELGIEPPVVSYTGPMSPPLPPPSNQRTANDDYNPGHTMERNRGSGSPETRRRNAR